jgi:hypothetical protein
MCQNAFRVAQILRCHRCVCTTHSAVGLHVRVVSGGPALAAERGPGKLERVEREVDKLWRLFSLSLVFVALILLLSRSPSVVFVFPAPDGVDIDNDRIGLCLLLLNFDLRQRNRFLGGDGNFWQRRNQEKVV